jgi:plasmid stabilization system protein ParE
MSRALVVDQEASEEAEAQARYYAERAGERVALRFVAELEAIYRGLSQGRFAGSIIRTYAFASRSSVCSWIATHTRSCSSTMVSE